MQHPPFQLPTQSDLFDAGFRRFVQERFPILETSISSLDKARRYAIKQEGLTIAEIETLPINADLLEVRVASLNRHGGNADRPASPHFGEAFYRWAAARYRTELPSPLMIELSEVGLGFAQTYED